MTHLAISPTKLNEIRRTVEGIQRTRDRFRCKPLNLAVLVDEYPLKGESRKNIILFVEGKMGVSERDRDPKKQRAYERANSRGIISTEEYVEISEVQTHLKFQVTGEGVDRYRAIGIIFPEIERHEKRDLRIVGKGKIEEKVTFCAQVRISTMQEIGGILEREEKLSAKIGAETVAEELDRIVQMSDALSRLRGTREMIAGRCVQRIRNSLGDMVGDLDGNLQRLIQSAKSNLGITQEVMEFFADRGN